MAVESLGERHSIVVTVPTAGWSLVLDRTLKYFDRTEVFVTISRPNPAFNYAQGDIRQFLDSTVDSREPMVVFARVIDHGAKGGEYRRAAASAPTKPPNPNAPAR